MGNFIQDWSKAIRSLPVRERPAAASDIELCGCGKPVRYWISQEQMACNKYVRCPSREEAIQRLEKRTAELLAAQAEIESLRAEREALVSLLTRYRKATKFGGREEILRTIAIEDEIDALLANWQANEQEQADER